MKRKIAGVLIIAFLVVSFGSINGSVLNAAEPEMESIENDKYTHEDNGENQKQEVAEDLDSNEVKQETQEQQMEDSKDIGEEPLEPEKEDKANSWRFTDGVLDSNIENNYLRSARAYNPNATRTGIDVSEHNGQINWEQVKNSGIDFAIIRCGYGMDQTDQDDKYWLRNVSECERLGIPFGVYIYSYATNTSRALSEAKHVLRLISGHKLSYPVYFDMEDTTTLGSDLTAIASTFCNTIKNAGYPVGVYANTNWWTNYLTDSTFSQWYRWVAQYNSTCTYTGEYAMWQYTSKGSVAGIVGNVDMNYLIGFPNEHGESISINVPDNMRNAVSYSSHVQDIGWMDEVSNGLLSGTIGSDRQLEAFKININNISGIGIEYQSYVEGIGWQNYVMGGEVSGTTGQNKAVEALRLRLTGEEANKYNVYYRTYVENLGWLDWAKNGEDAGTVGYDYPLEAYQIALLPADADAPGSIAVPFKYKDPSLNLSYKVHVSKLGWQDPVQNGEIAGTTGKSLGVEAYSLDMFMEGLNIKYTSFVEGSGWQEYVSGGEISGTIGKGKNIEAIKVELDGINKDKFNVFYRVHAENLGWLDWTKNGEAAGTEDYDFNIEAIQIMLLPSNSEYAPNTGNNAFLKKSSGVDYAAHVEDIGWQDYVSDGETAGTTGRSKQVEALRIRLENKDYEGGIKYRAHVEDIGWQDYVREGEIAGTVGKNKQIEALGIQLTGKMAENYDVYYRVHSSEFGWLGWAKNGENAGSQGYGRPVEALQIRLVKKGGEAPGDTNNAFVKKTVNVDYAAHVEDIGWQDYVSDGETAGTTGRSKQVEALRIRLENKDYEGGIKYRAHVEDIGWQDYVREGEIAGTVGKNKQIEALGIQLTGKMAENYDVYYRVHSSEFGWLGWAKNGENAGSQGYGRPVEALQIRLVKKGGEAPGDTNNIFYKR